MRVLATYNIDYEIAEKWSDKVTDTETFHTPPGLFTKSAEDIANFLHAHSDSLKQAVSRLTFYRNRAGKNLSEQEEHTLDKAHDKLVSLFAA